MERPLRGHWGNRSNSDFLYQIGFDFVAQLEDIMEHEEIGRAELAKRLGVSKGRVSQILNNPGNLGLENVVKYARALRHKVAIVAYNDGDAANENGPISPQVFVTCWEMVGRPTDMFSAGAVTASTGQARLSEYWRPMPVALDDRDDKADTTGVKVLPADATKWSDYARTNVF